MKIVVGGQIEKEVLATALRTAFDARNTAVEVAVLNDIEAAMAIQSGAADYYFGACNTGGGGGNTYRAQHGDPTSSMVTIEDGGNIGYLASGEWYIYSISVNDAHINS